MYNTVVFLERNILTKDKPGSFIQNIRISVNTQSRSSLLTCLIHYASEKEMMQSALTWIGDMTPVA